jgi:hypothetical protein
MQKVATGGDVVWGMGSVLRSLKNPGDKSDELTL